MNSTLERGKGRGSNRCVFVPRFVRNRENSRELIWDNWSFIKIWEFRNYRWDIYWLFSEVPRWNIFIIANIFRTIFFIYGFNIKRPQKTIESNPSWRTAEEYMKGNALWKSACFGKKQLIPYLQNENKSGNANQWF